MRHATLPVRLLLLTDSPITISGGSERFLRNLVNGIPREQFVVSVVQLCNEPPADAHVHAAAIRDSVDVSYLPCAAVYGSAGRHAWRSLRQRILREGFHIIQSQHENADVINSLLPRGPLGAIRISNRRDTGFLKSAKLRLASRLLNHRFDRIVAPTPAILDAVAATEHAPRERMLCIPNGVDDTRFKPGDTATRLRVRTALALAPDTLLVGCVADLFAVKRHVDLIDAFARVHADLPDAHLLLIGDGPLRAEIEARTRERGVAGAVHLLGSRSDVDALLPVMDLFVLASETEGLSNAILEAQACGLPVVATAVGGNPDLVDASCGALVPAHDPAALATALLALLRDPVARTRMGADARARVISHHSVESMVHAYAALYRELAHAR